MLICFEIILSVDRQRIYDVPWSSVEVNRKLHTSIRRSSDITTNLIFRPIHRVAQKSKPLPNEKNLITRESY